jgi:hypothetical protein
MSYTTRDKVEKLINEDLSGIDSTVTAWIASVKAWIDRYCGRVFEAASETRYYDGNRKDRILVDPFVGNATVLLLNYDGSTWMTLTQGTGSDFLPYPLNATEKFELVLMPNARVGIFARAFENILDEVDGETDADVKRLVSVNATFGGSLTCPADVELAATQLVAFLAKTRTGGGSGTVKSEKLGDYAITYSDNEMDEAANALGIYSILDGYREPTI